MPRCGLSWGRLASKLNMQRLLHAIFLFAAFYAAVASEESRRPSVISLPGEQRLFDGKLVFEITHTQKGDHLHFGISWGRGGCGFPAYPGWRVYPESPTTLWVFDGRDALQRVTLGPEGISVALARPRSAIIAEAPKEFLRTLPVQLQ